MILRNIEKNSMVGNDIHIVKIGPHQQDTVMYTDGVSRTVCVGCHGNTNSYLKIFTNDGRIRKMTPREVGRLMDVDDGDLDRMLSCGLSDSAVTSLFGNSIVVNVMTEMFRELFYEDKTPVEIQLF